MARVNHKKVRQLLNQERSSITDKQFFVSRILAGHFADIAAAQSKRYGYNRRVDVRIVWEPINGEAACTDNSLIWINAATPLVKAKKSRQARYEVVCGLFAHELGHVLYTDFLLGQTHAAKTLDGGWFPARPACAELSHRLNVDEIEEYRNQGPIYQMAFTRLSHHLHNILEDGYIEETMLRRFPGVLGANLNIMRESVWEDPKTVTLLIEQEEDERMKWRSILQIMLSYCLYGEIKYGETALTDERIQAVFHSLDELDAGLTCTDPRIRWQMVNQIIVRNWHYVKPYLEFCEERSKAAGGDLSAMLDALFEALNGSTAEGSGVTNRKMMKTRLRRRTRTMLQKLLQPAETPRRSAQLGTAAALRMPAKRPVNRLKSRKKKAGAFLSCRRIMFPHPTAARWNMTTTTRAQGMTPPPGISKLCSTVWRRSGWKSSARRSSMIWPKAFPTATSMRALK